MVERFLNSVGVGGILQQDTDGLTVEEASVDDEWTRVRHRHICLDQFIVRFVVFHACGPDRQGRDARKSSIAIREERAGSGCILAQD